MSNTLLEKAEKFWYTTPKTVLVPLAMLVMLLKSGIWFIPNIHYSFVIAQNPFVNPFPDEAHAHYLLNSWLAPFLAWCIGASKSYATFFLLHVFFMVAASLVFVQCLFKTLPDHVARTAFALFLLLPVSYTGYYWVGNDALTLLLMSAMLAARCMWPLAFVLGAALGLQHFEQGFFAFGALAGVLTLDHVFNKNQFTFFSLRWVYASFAGVCTGKVLQILLFKQAGIVIEGNRVDWFLANAQNLVSQFFYGAQTEIWSVLGLGWGVIVLLVMQQGAKNLWYFLAALLGLMGLLLLVEDQTRVLSIITFPLVTVGVLLNKNFLASLKPALVMLLLCIWVLMPISWVWAGKAHDSVTPYNIALPLHYLTGQPSVPPFDSLPTWPFR